MIPTKPHAGLIVLALWLATAIAFSASGLLAHVRPPIPQLILLTLTAAVLTAGVYSTGLRRWAHSVDLRVIVAVHLSRFVGVYFLILYGRNELPYAFAVPGGWGDIIVATTAMLLLIAVRPNTKEGKRLYLYWNTIGLIDIIAVVATATVQATLNPQSMEALLRLPLSLLPLFLVPLIIASHVLIFERLTRRQSAASRPQHAMTA